MPIPHDDTRQIETNGSFSDTETAVAYVAGKAQDDWDIIIGSAGGAYTWGSQLSVDIPFKTTLSSPSSSNKASITSTAATGQGIALNCADGKTITVKDLIFPEWTPANCLFLVTGGGVDCFRFTNVKWIHEGPSNAAYISTASSGRTDAGPYGLIDHVQILGSGYGFFIRDNNSLESWRRPMSLGARNAVYIEDSLFGGTSFISGSPVVDSNSGARWVMRNSVFVDQALANHGAQDGSGGSTGGSLQHEVMHNTFLSTIAGNGPSLFTLMLFRGGVQYIFDNDFNIESGGPEGGSPIRQDFFRAEGGVTIDRFYPADYVGTQQPGMGVIPGVFGGDPNYPLEPWGSIPSRFWSNRRTGNWSSNGDVPSTAVRWNAGGFVVRDRDFFESSDDSARPVGYAEYVYPHPLNSGVEPSAPVNTIIPVLSGLANVGETITITPGTYLGSTPIAKTYQKQRRAL